jgi:hypothetical protein
LGARILIGVRNERERRLYLLAGYRYFPNHLAGVFALLLFFVALVLGAGLAIVLRGLL